VMFGEVGLVEHPPPVTGLADFGQHHQGVELPRVNKCRLSRLVPVADTVAFVSEGARLEFALGSDAKPVFGELVAEFVGHKQRIGQQTRIAGDLDDGLVWVVPAQSAHGQLVEPLAEGAVGGVDVQDGDDGGVGHVPGDIEAVLELLESAQSEQGVPDDEQTPALSHHLQGARYGAHPGHTWSS
jgi:hypothetical protein